MSDLEVMRSLSAMRAVYRYSSRIRSKSSFVGPGEQIPLLFGPCVHCGKGYVQNLPAPCPSCGTPLTMVLGCSPYRPLKHFYKKYWPMVLFLRVWVLVFGFVKRRYPLMFYMLASHE